MDMYDECGCVRIHLDFNHNKGKNWNLLLNIFVHVCANLLPYAACSAHPCKPQTGRAQNFPLDTAEKFVQGDHVRRNGLQA